MINWKVRMKNKAFWLALIPAVLLLVEAAAGAVGVQLDFSDAGQRLAAVVNALFALLTVLGVINDPTTAGLQDSGRAMTYEEPV